MSVKNILKTCVGIIFGILCITLSLRQVNLEDMLVALRKADYSLVILSVLVLVFSYYVRTMRWRLLLLPLKRVNESSLFSALVIGYAANMFFPAHLGELLRAFVLSKKNELPMTAIFATIITERIIDIFALLVVMAAVIYFYPFPLWMITSGYLMLAGAAVLFFVMVMLRLFQRNALLWAKRILMIAPGQLDKKVLNRLERFISGISPLSKKSHYLYIAIMSVAIWVCYGMVYYLNLVAFHFDEMYPIPWYATLVVLVVTTLSIVIPSSPGYVGTFHYLCQLSLMMFGVGAGEALSYATVVHAVNILPASAVGLVMANIEGVSILRTHKRKFNENI